MKKLILISISLFLFLSTFSQINNKSIPILYGVYSSDTLNVWAIGKTGTIIHSIDGGYSWTDHSVNTLKPLRSIDFSSETNGFIVGDSGTILRTVDGGINWQYFDIGAEYNLDHLIFTDENHGWILEKIHWLEGYGLHRTTNGGVNWNFISIPFETISFIDSLNGWGAYRDDNTYYKDFVFRTFDGGLTWDTIWDTQYEHILNISFCDSLTGVYSFHDPGNNGGSRKSYDGGHTWDYSGIGYFFTVICFPDANNIWIRGREYQQPSNVTYSNDLFNSYDYFAMNDGDVTGISARGFNDGWAVGFNNEIGRVWKLNGINEWIQVIGVGLSEKTSNGLTINCYPNPTSSLTNISISIQDESNLSISLHSRNGQKIQDIYSGEKRAGTHQFSINCSNLSNGIYLVKVQLGKDVEVIKLAVK